MKALCIFTFGLIAGVMLEDPAHNETARALGEWTRCHVLGDCVHRGMK